MEWKIIFNGLYRLSENGDIYSFRKKKLLRGSVNGGAYAYHMYFLDGRWYYTHRLVYEFFIGEIPRDREISHIDDNKLNNHYSNLKMVTHQQNMIKGRQHDWKMEREAGFKHSFVTREKMAEAKMKEVEVWHNDRLYRICKSIEETSVYLGTYRKKVQRALISGKLTRFPVGMYSLKLTKV